MKKTIPVRHYDFMLIVTDEETVDRIPYDTEQEAQDAIVRIENHFREKRERHTKTFEIINISKKKIFRIPCTWQMYGTLHIEAESAEEANKIANNPETSLPTNGEYIEDSFETEEEEIEEEE
ncbi:hypothetical protein HN499_05840 [archaeon]|nr:hypothetical protein [archaeon]